MRHTNVECFAWHEVPCESDDPCRSCPESYKIWETDSEENALCEYTKLLKTHAANDLTLLQPVLVDVLAAVRNISDDGVGSTDNDSGDILDDDI